MTTAATITAQLILDANGFSSGIDKATKSANDFQNKMMSIGSTMQKVGAGMSLAVTVPIVAFGTSAVKAAMDHEAAVADLNATIKSTGGVAGVTSDEVQKYADKMQMLTKFSKDEIMHGDAMLLTFTNIGKDVFPAASNAALDMAQKFGYDMPQAATILGKALNDPKEGLTALRRIGIMFNDDQKKQIDAFMQTNDVAGAQGVILKEVQKELGGVAEAYGKTAGGQMEIFNHHIDELKESLGNALIPALIRLMDAITPVIDAFASAPPWVQDLIVVFFGLVALAGPLIGFVGTVMTFIGGLAGMGVTFAGVGTAIGAIGTFIGATLIPAIVAALPILALIAAAVILVWLVWSHWTELSTTVSQLWFLIKAAWNQGVLYIISKVQEVQVRAGTAWKIISQFGSDAINTVKTKFTELGQWASDIYKNITDGFRTAFEWVVNIAKNVFGGIANAISQVIGYVNRLIQALANIKLPAALTPGSPTPFEIGLRGISDAMDVMTSKSIPALNGGLKLAPASINGLGGGGSRNYYDYRQFAGGMGKDELQTALDAKFGTEVDEMLWQTKRS